MNPKRAIEISVMIGSALLEVGGDALIRKGWRGGGLTHATRAPKHERT